MKTITEVQEFGGQILQRFNFLFAYKENLIKDTKYQELCRFWKQNYIRTKARNLIIYYILSSTIITEVRYEELERVDNAVPTQPLRLLLSRSTPVRNLQN
jgi:hypothetical protein